MAKRSISAIMMFALLTFYPAAASAMTVYMKNDDRIDAESAWRSNGRVFIKIDRDALIDFSEEEVDLAKTFSRKKRAAKSQVKTVKADVASGVKSAPKVAQNNPGQSVPDKKEKMPPKVKESLKDENLLVSLAKGYKIDFQTRQGNVLLTEMVPEGESVDNWTEMLTTQVFLGGVSQPSPAAFSEALSAVWIRSCQGAEIQHIRKGTENGYPFSFWAQTCPRNPMTGKPETTVLKAIQGNESFYVVQKAWKYSPSDEETAIWSRFMSKVRVCDSRIKGRECP